jgi:hypothetical protein
VYADVQSRIRRFGLEEFIHLKQRDLYDASYDFGLDSVDFMHIDVSNTGETIRDVVNEWDQRIRPGGLVLFEGGSPLRDEVSWMKRYNKDRIGDEINSNNMLKRRYTFLVLHPYPSMLICCKNIQVDEEAWEKYAYGDFEAGGRHDEIDEDELFKMISEDQWIKNMDPIAK